MKFYKKINIKFNNLKMGEIFKLVKSKLHFWFLCPKSQFGPKDENYIQLERLVSTKSFRKHDSIMIKDIIMLITKLEPHNFELNETNDAIRIPLNHPLRTIQKLGL
jgi:hypothetical protein